MRVTSDFYVSALIRRAFAGGGFATVEKRGSTEAGAIFLRRRNRMGEVSLYGPAPQSDYATDRPSGRLFVVLLKDADDTSVMKRLDKELRFDPDLWLVELEVDEERFAELVEVMTP